MPTQITQQALATSTGGLRVAHDYSTLPEGSASFGDVMDAVNPLHHIPVVGNMYREITDDEIGFVPRAIGGLIYGGPIGFAAALINGLIEEFTDNDLGGHAVAMLGDAVGFGGDDGDVTPDGETFLAEIPADAQPAPDLPPMEDPILLAMLEQNLPSA